MGKPGTSGGAGGGDQSWSHSPRGGGGQQGGGGGTTGLLSLAEIRVLARKAMKAHSDWPDTDDLLDVVYWSRQILGAILGLAWGLLSLKGLIGLALFVLISTGLVHFYVTSFQAVDEDTLGGFMEVAKEGFMSSFATFLICWIITYSALYS